MSKKFILSVIALFVVAMILGFIIHVLLLGEDYKALGPLMRSQEEQTAFFLWMVLAYVLLATGITGLYRKGYEAGKPWFGQGVRFGIWLALAAPVANYLVYYAVQPMPGVLVAKQIIFDSIGAILIGITAAAVNK